MKKNITIIFFLTLLIATISYANCNCGLKGDINNDGMIGLHEAISALQIMSGLKAEATTTVLITTTSSTTISTINTTTSTSTTSTTTTTISITTSTTTTATTTLAAPTTTTTTIVPSTIIITTTTTSSTTIIHITTTTTSIMSNSTTTTVVSNITTTSINIQCPSTTMYMSHFLPVRNITCAFDSETDIALISWEDPKNGFCITYYLVQYQIEGEDNWISSEMLPNRSFAIKFPVAQKKYNINVLYWTPCACNYSPTESISVVLKDVEVSSTTTLLETSTSSTSTTTIPGTIAESKRQALIALYNNTSGDNWRYNTGWQEEPLSSDGFALPGTECDWYGVTCNSENKITKLSLWSNQLSGSIPTELGNLTNLTKLSLSVNQLSGSIPTELTKITNLKELYLNSNQLSGSIPTELANLINISTLYLYGNNFDCPTDQDLINFLKVKSLYWKCGEIPTTTTTTTTFTITTPQSTLPFTTTTFTF